MNETNGTSAIDQKDEAAGKSFGTTVETIETTDETDDICHRYQLPHLFLQTFQ